MNIKTVKVGFLGTNCYIISLNNQCLIVDPGADSDKIIESVQDNEVIGILLTHEHFDHIGALEKIKQKYKVPVYKKDSVKENDYQIGSLNFEVIFTPGHTSDSITFYFKDFDTMFTGDFLFCQTIGRTDLPTGNVSNMEKSIDKMKSYKGCIKIYPGHGKDSTLEFEFNNNPYFK